ncbi:MAG: hypothetical protein WC971_04980 [Coriobacteriia bacterium]
MRRILGIAATAFGVLAILAMTGYTFANAGDAGKMSGVIVDKKNAAIEVMDQPGAKGSITVARVLAPGRSWIAVHLDEGGKPGKRVGLLEIGEGESRDVKVEIDDVKLSDKLIVALHADRGVAGEFEFAMDDFALSPDKPYFVDGMELAMEASVAEKPFGVTAAEGEAAIEVADQPGAAGSIAVARALAPTGAWIVVHLDDGGKPGKRAGFQRIPAGDNADVVVSLDPTVTLTDRLFVAIHADRGVAGELEFDMMDKYNSPDQPFFVDGEEVATAARVR